MVVVLMGLGSLGRVRLASVMLATLALTLVGCGAAGVSDGAAPRGGLGTGTGIAELEWEPPTANEDGSPLTDLAGYKVYYGDGPRQYSEVVDIGDTTQYTVDFLPSGRIYFAVAAYDLSGNESFFSNEVSKSFP